MRDASFHEAGSLGGSGRRFIAGAGSVGFMGFMLGGEGAGGGCGVVRRVPSRAARGEGRLGTGRDSAGAAGRS
jgi:hypothetical protein